MKKYFFLLLLSFTAAFAVTENVHAQSLLYTGEMGPDTLSASDTVYQYPNGTSVATSRRFTSLGAMEVVTVIDSLSGNPAGTLTLQACYDLNCTKWYDAGTATINGVQTVFRFEDTVFIPTRYRIRLITTSTTQSIVAQSVYAFKKTL